MLTDSQKNWFWTKNIQAGEWYMFPRFGFRVYTQPKYTTGEYMDTNPWFKSLDHEYFEVKEKVNGFCRGNFYNKPVANDFYLEESELATRNIIEVAFLYLTCSIPLIIYNLCKNGRKK